MFRYIFWIVALGNVAFTQLASAASTELPPPTEVIPVSSPVPSLAASPTPLQVIAVPTVRAPSPGEPGSATANISASATASPAVTRATPSSESLAVPPLMEQIKQACSETFASLYQEKLKDTCREGAQIAAAKGLQTASEVCKLSNKDHERARMVCLTGAAIGEDLRLKQDFYKDKVAACRDLYPITTQIDVYLQEACLTGIQQPIFGARRPSLQVCRNISADRSFVAPCGVGLSMAYEMASQPEAQANKQVASENKMCLSYFDKAAFHLGYRACLNSRSLMLDEPKKHDDIIQRCNRLIANDKSEAERASCIVGASLYQHKKTIDKIATRFKTCGDTKVTYAEHGTLACLTAVSLLDFMTKDQARKACKKVFTARKSRSRGDCMAALN
jgi:hypothetical protein